MYTSPRICYDLTVMPNGIDYTSFSLLQELGIKNPSSVKEIVMKITKEKVLDLLKCSLLSKTALTDLILRKKPSLGSSRFFSSDVEISGKIQIILKLVIRKSDGKAELLVRIFGENCSLASINGLYKSIADLNENKYMISKEAKNRLVDPCISPQIKLSKQILPILEPGVPEYYCYYQGYNIFCAQFFKPGEDKSYAGYTRKLNLSTMGSPNEGYVKGPAMYVATDDLVVAPLSPISALGLLNRFKTPLNDMKEKVVTLGIKECLNILNASLTSICPNKWFGSPAN